MKAVRGSAPGACPRPRKIRFATSVVAEDVAVERGLKHGITLYVYPCDCGWWHLTKSPPRLAA